MSYVAHYIVVLLVFNVRNSFSVFVVGETKLDYTVG